jgi:glycosyltransferase involved in cell wall biosynthesis
VIHCADSFRLFGGVPAQPVVVDPRVVLHTLRSPAGPLSPAATYFTGRPWLKPLERILARGFDVIHWHNASLVGGPGGFSLGDAGAVKLCTLHEYWLMCPVSTLFRYRRETCTKRTCWRCSLSYRRPPQFWRSFDSVLAEGIAHIHRFLAPSSYTAERYRKSGMGIDPTVLPLFASHAARRPATESAGGYFLFAGRLEISKGLHTVLPVFARGGHRLRIAGDGGQRRLLERQAGGVPGIEFLGPRPHGELAPLYAGALATIIPSLSEETFGLVGLESLRNGTPVIVRNRGALPEMVRSTGGGWVFDTEEELAAILSAVRADPAAARRRAADADLSRFSREAHLDAYLRVIGEERVRPR